MQRHGQPGGAIFRLISHFIRRLLQTEQRQRGILAFGILPCMGKTSCRQPISVDKCLPRLAQVAIGDPQARGIGRCGVIDALHVDRHRRRIVEGPQHAADILVRAVFAPSFMQWPGRFAFEVDQVGIALDHQHLPQVQVAVYTNAQAARGLFAQRLYMAEDGFLVVQ
ncbi:hypothetical protein D3C72_1295000 [compost metagenome]